MSWAIIPEFRLPDEPEALTYIAAVEAADGQALEPAVKLAINAFIKGCKNDGIWPAIKASCILAGARTLTGALVPLVGTAPTNVSDLFVSGDYNRKTGLVGDGSTRYLNTNYNPGPTINIHGFVYRTVAEGAGAQTLFSSNNTNVSSTRVEVTATNRIYRAAGNAANLADTSRVTGGVGVSRTEITTGTYRYNSATNSITGTNVPATTLAFTVFGAIGGTSLTTAQIPFYSFGESLDLALLDARVTDLINAFDAAI
jgi:hypothetical protein